MRVINGYDSFGNTCGVTKNERYKNFPLSGMNTIDKPQLLYFDLRELKKSLKLCVKECPTRTLENSADLYNYYQQTQTKLCRYDFDMNLISSAQTTSVTNYFNYMGPCPTLPIYERFEAILMIVYVKLNKCNNLKYFFIFIQFTCIASLYAQR